MALVVDSSIAVSWILPDESSEAASKALEIVSKGGMIAPRIFWYEFRNTLLVNERRGRLIADESEQALLVMAAIDPEMFDGHSELELLRLSRKHGLSVYDAAYVELALRKNTPLATLDGKMAAAGAAEGLAVIQ